jgi:phage terminase large subunit-like protein
MSAVVDLTALVIGSAGEKTKVKPYIWKPEDLLKDHSDRDFGSGNARYVQWHKEGHLLVSPGRSIDPAVVAIKIAELVNEYTVLGLAYDRWRIADLLREFDRIGLQAWEDKGGDKQGAGLRLIPWGQGFKDMAPAIDALELDVIERNLVHSSNPVLTWAMANAVATMDPAGNRKLDKDKARFRIDPAVALTMMCGLKSRDRKKEAGNLDDFLANPVMVV